MSKLAMPPGSLPRLAALGEHNADCSGPLCLSFKPLCPPGAELRNDSGDEDEMND
jgi:hypothetical protein